MDQVIYILVLFATVLLGLVQGNGLNCQRSAYLKAKFGSITEPLYPDKSTADGIGLRSCWFFNHTLQEDYIVGVELKSINVGSTMANSLWFSGHNPIFRKKTSPFCFLYLRGNNTCSKDRAVSAMDRLMPTCRGNTKVVVAKILPSFVVLSSNKINAWREKIMNFHVDYRFLSCGPAVVPPSGEGSVAKPADGVSPSSSPCQSDAKFNKLSQNSTTNLMPAVIALAVILGIETMILIIVLLRYRSFRQGTKEERHLTKVLHTNGREISPSEYGQMQVHLRS